MKIWKNFAGINRKGELLADKPTQFCDLPDFYCKTGFLRNPLCPWVYRIHIGPYHVKGIF